MKNKNNANILLAQKARAEKVLNSLQIWKGRVIIKKDWLQALINEGYTLKIELVPKKKYNRTKFNRMTDTKEQDQYLKDTTEKTQTEYRIAKEDGLYTHYYTLTKIEYDYSLTLIPKI